MSGTNGRNGAGGANGASDSAGRAAYWRGVGHRAGSEEYRDWLEREFPEGASELPEGVSRRSMLALMGSSLALAGLAGCRRPVERIVPYGKPPEEVIPGIPRHYASTMPFGTTAYGVVVETHEGRPTKIEGNEAHPMSRGASSAFMQASILDLYDPDRAKGVTKGGEASDADAFAAAWAALAEAHAADGGARLAVLSDEFSSPTLARLRRAFLERYPSARWIAWSPLSNENQREGLRLATGAPRSVLPRLAECDVIVALDADFVLDPAGVRLAGDFARGRRLHGTGGRMNRLYAAEGTWTLTGAMADSRRRVRPGQIAALAAALAGRLASHGVATGAPAAPGPAGVDDAWLDAVAADLAGARGRSAILCGPGQPAAVHAAVHALNTALGNVGRTIQTVSSRDALHSDAPALAELAHALHQGAVDTLVTLGGNPAYDAPASLQFGEALAQAKTVIAVSDRVDETARRAAWHVPLAHWLESWGDAVSEEGTLSVIQPMIAPLYGALPAVEVAGLIATGTRTPAHELVRDTWRPVLGAGFEPAWQKVLHDGVLQGQQGTLGAAPARAGAWPPLPSASGDGLELVLTPSASTWDGRFANNAWLMETPDPVTKLTWGNAALMSAGTMASLGLADGQVVTVSRGAASVTLPAWTVPGQADGVVALAAGYGRTDAGRVGNGTGGNGWMLRETAGAWFAGGASVAATGESRVMACTQDHGSMEGRPIVREATLEHFRARPKFALDPALKTFRRDGADADDPVEGGRFVQLIPDHPYESGPQWGMSIDLTLCTGCNACMVACQSENNVPVVGADQVTRGREMHWLRVDRYFVTESRKAPFDDARMIFQPVPCMQCENAPCEQVCPVAATTHDSHGLNVMVYNRCIGTRYCSNNCPYKVRRFNFYNFTKSMPASYQLAMNPDVTVRSRGVMEKCTYCTQRINAAQLEAKLAGRALEDGDVVTACQQACPTQAIRFGDILDPGSKVVDAKRETRSYAMLAELNNRPRTTYLARIRNPGALEPLHLEPEAGHEDDHGDDHGAGHGEG